MGGDEKLRIKKVICKTDIMCILYVHPINISSVMKQQRKVSLAKVIEKVCFKLYNVF